MDYIAVLRARVATCVGCHVCVTCCATCESTHLKVLHKHGNDDVDEDELRHEDEDDEVDGGNDGVHATVGQTVVRAVTVLPQRVL